MNQSTNKEPPQLEVGAVEDLMREHGILRRALLVYSEAAEKLRTNPSAVPAALIHSTAELFRSFGEDYHEKKLEEGYVFDVVKKSGSQASIYPEILIAQHQRGRQITDYILAATEGPATQAQDPEQLIKAMEAAVRMYRAHAAREDTVVFPAWKKLLTAQQLADISERFEDIEHQLFGEDGFDNVVRRIAAIEDLLGIADLAKFTAAPITT